MPAATIDDVIIDAATDIATVSYAGVKSLFTQTNIWIASVFAEGGIFPPSKNELASPGQRPVTGWYATTNMARDSIPGPGVGQSSLVDTCAVINAVERTAYAVKYAVINGFITSAQQTAVVAAYNTAWT